LPERRKFSEEVVVVKRGVGVPALAGAFPPQGGTPTPLFLIGTKGERSDFYRLITPPIFCGQTRQTPTPYFAQFPLTAVIFVIKKKIPSL